MIRLYALALLALTLLPTQAEAQEDNPGWIRYVWKQRCYQHADMFGAVTYPCRRWRVPVRGDYAPRVYDYERRDEPRRYYSAPDLHPTPFYGPRCKERIVQAVGFEYANDERAMKSAQLIWAATVRQESGEFYIDMAQARDVLTICTPASVNDTVIGKLGEAAFGENAVLKRCRIWARPCRPEIEHASFDDKGKPEPPVNVRRNDPRDNYYEPAPPKKRRWYWRPMRRD